MITNAAILAPRLLPRLVMVASASADDREIAQHLRLVGKQEAKLRVGNYRRAQPIDPILHPPFAIERERHAEDIAGRCDADILRVRKRRCGNGKQQGKGGNEADQHRATYPEAGGNKVAAGSAPPVWTTRASARGATGAGRSDRLNTHSNRSPSCSRSNATT